MTPEQFARARALFEDALSLSPEARSDFLVRSCPEDAEVRAEVERLLATPTRHSVLDHLQAEVGEALAGRLSDSDERTLEMSPRERGVDLGNYRLLEKLGEGGMGEVWAARQESPIRRRVAVKLIKRGMDTAELLRRFDAERQALAMMDHPNIARVFDAGETPDGRPYFAMEYVAGVPFTDYCDLNRLTTRERLELFMAVCDGVQHAHQKAILHRDLKPSNVLVTAHEGRPVPKIIDFGVAKALAQPLTEGTLFTELGQLVGTPEYMSPEQADFTGLDVDTRTDVYSLGVMLYELLVGERPFDSKRLREAGFAGLCRIIREDEPARPSDRLRTASDATTRSAHNRRTGVRELVGQVRGDLDWITMKALEKERNRRYGSASELAADIRRYLHHEPISARPPSTAYRMRKFVRRHRLQVGFAAMLLVVLVAFAAAMWVQAGRVARERDLAARERDRANLEAKAAQRQADRATAVTSFLTDVLGSAHPEGGMGRGTTVVEALDAARTMVDDAFGDSPDIRAAVLAMIGQTYTALGRFQEAEGLLRSALEEQRRELGEESLEVAETLRALGDLKEQQGTLEEAESLLKRSLAVRESLLGRDHLLVGESLNSLGNLYFTRGDAAAAARELRRAVAIFEREYPTLSGKRKRRLAVVLANLAPAVEASDPEEAIRLYRRALEVWAALGLTKTPGYAATLANYGLLLRDRGDLAGAEPLLREALTLDRELTGDRHVNAGISLVNLAGLIRDKGDPAAGRAMFLEAIEILEASLGAEHWRVARAREGLGVCWLREGRLAEAERELLAAHAGLSKALGASDERTRHAAASLAELYEARRRPEEAERYRAPRSTSG